MDAVQLQEKYIHDFKELFNEGLVGRNFNSHYMMQTETNPRFASEMVSIYLKVSETRINMLASTLVSQPVDYKEVERHLFLLNASSICMGAVSIKAISDDLALSSARQDYLECLSHLERIKHKHSILKQKLVSLLKLEEQVLAADGSISKVSDLAKIATAISEIDSRMVDDLLSGDEHDKEGKLVI